MAIGLLGLSVVGLKKGLTTLGVFALVVAFASATQDIVVDAWRIEAASNSDELGLLSGVTDIFTRGLWREVHSLSGRICADWVNRDWMYGLAFYRGSLYPPCSTGKYDYALQSQQHERPVLVQLH